MIRGAVVGLINNKSLSQQSGGYDDGRAVTLMSIDADNVSDAASMFHETWAQMVEVVLGMAMLAREVGWVFPVPLVIIFCKLAVVVSLAAEN
jgi:ATP-binding cassette, subfamily C (CFTR/MRP), member 1